LKWAKFYVDALYSDERCETRSSADVAKGHDTRFAWFVVEPNREHLIQIGTLIDAGHIRPIIETVLPLSQARQAYEQGAKGHTCGKIVLRVVDG
jgi:NADPH:quinone reductase-like Zn-dependent oxidoreductase